MLMYRAAHNLIAGTLSVQCAATGLAASIRFLSGRRVDGSLNRLQGQGSAIVARIAGSWDSSIDVDVPEWNAEGVVPVSHSLSKFCYLFIHN